MQTRNLKKILNFRLRGGGSLNPQPPIWVRQWSTPKEQDSWWPADRGSARLPHNHVIRSDVADAAEALLDRLREHAAHRQHRKHAQRMRHAGVTSAGSGHRLQIGEDGDQHVLVVGGGRLVGKAERPSQPCAHVHHGRRPQNYELAASVYALERNFGVRVLDGRVALAHPNHPSH